MRRGSGQTVLRQDVFDLLSSAAEVSCEFHFLVPDLRDFGDGAFEIVLHQVPHRVELDGDLIDLVLAGCPSEATAEQGGCADGRCGFQKGAAIHGMETHDCVPPRDSAEAETKSASIIRARRNQRTKTLL